MRFSGVTNENLYKFSSFCPCHSIQLRRINQTRFANGCIYRDDIAWYTLVAFDTWEMKRKTDQYFIQR